MISVQTKDKNYICPIQIKDKDKDDICPIQVDFDEDGCFDEAPYLLSKYDGYQQVDKFKILHNTKIF